MFNPVNVAVAQTRSGTEKSSKKKGNERTVELTYGEAVSKNSEYAEQDGVLYRWNKSHYQAIRPTDGDGEKAVMAWLARSHPDKATPRMAKECFKSALMMARPLPTRPHDRVIIPLKNAYLEIKDNGTIVRMNPDPALGITYVLNAELPGTGNTYMPAEVPEDSFLNRYLTSSLPDAEVRNFLQELAGDTLIPSIRHQKATLLKGRGRNGKSIYTRLLTALHQKTAPLRLDSLKGFGLMPLIGASLVIVDEVPKYGMDEQTFKTLVSGEAITIDMKHRDQIRYSSHAKWVISTNNDQKVSDNSDGFWRRLTIIPFDHQIPENEVIPCLDEKIITNELLHFLDWCLIGLQRYLQRGDLPANPAAVNAAKKAAVQASNSVEAWSADIGPRITTEATAPKDTIYGHYANWCDRQRLHALSGGQFWKALRSKFPEMGEERQIRKKGERVRCVPMTLEEPRQASQDCPFDETA